GFDLNDLTLTRDGSPVALTDATLSGSGANYAVDNLQGITGVSGAYVLTLKASGSGIVDTAGNALTSNASDSFVIDNVAPIADIVDVTPALRNSGVNSI